MENRKFVIFVLAVLLPLFSLAYDDDTTHPALTQESIKLFQATYQDPALSAGDISSLERGSADEDSAPRWLHHFFEPHSDIGLWGLMPSPVWAEDTVAQGEFLKLSNFVGDRFSRASDFSWERGIYEYVYGDRDRALRTLGHVIHLVQDKAVPEHTRLDAHNPSPYEAWAEKFTVDSIDLTVSGGPIALSSLRDHFDNMATFSNENFFSPDTFEEFDLPRIKTIKHEKLSDGLIYNFGYGDNGKLVRIFTEIDKKTGKLKTKYFLSDVDKKIFTDYWNALAPEAIRHSAGVMKLFFDEVEKEKSTKELYEKNKGLATKAKEKLLSLIDKTADLLNFSAPDQLAAVPPALSPEVATSTPAEEELETLPPPAEQEEIDRMYEAVRGLLGRLAELRATAATAEAFAVPELARTLKNIISSGSGHSSGGDALAVVVAETSDLATTTGTTTPEKTEQPSFAIIEPADPGQTFAERVMIFTGSSTDVARVGADWQNASTSPAADGSWSLELSGLPDGTTTIIFYAESPSGLLADPIAVEIAIFVPPAPAEFTLTVAECAESVISNLCVMPDYNVVGLSWPDLGEGYEYTIGREYDNFGRPTFVQRIATTTDVSYPLDLDDWGYFENGDSIKVVAHKNGEMFASSSQMIFVEPRPLVINEVGWLGTRASSGDEWLELATGITGRVVLLNSIFIQVGDGPEQELSDRISCEDDDFDTCLYLVEIGSDEAVSDLPADLIYPGADPSGSLDDASPRIRIISRNGGRESVLDSLVSDLPAAIAGCGQFDAEDGEECYPEQATTTRPSLERIRVYESSESDNWSFNKSWRAAFGKDRDSNNIAGTPKKINSVSLIDSF